ncbi:MAG: AMIN domain-containing protein [Candidatus Zixiibacteriota bacterium]
MQNKIKKFLALIVLISNTFAAYNVIEFEISCKNDRTNISVFTSSVPSVQDTILSSPDRLVLDFENGIHQLKSKEFSNLPAGLLMRVRSSQFKPEPNRVTRLVFDLAEAPNNYSVEKDDEGLKISIPTPDYPTIESYKSGRKANIPPAPKEEKPEPKKEVKPEPEPEKKPETKEPDEEKVETEPKPKEEHESKEEQEPKEKQEQQLQIEEADEEQLTIDTTETDRSEYFRSRIEYERTVDRDPFIRVSNEIAAEIGDVRLPNYENLSLVGIVGTEGNYNALMQDSKGFGYMFVPGDSVLNGIVVSVNDTSITFSINEYGYIREVSMSLEKGN